MSQRSCLRCDTPMHVGYIIDHAETGVRHTAKWVAGPPEKSWFTGLKKKEAIDILAYRCPMCGMLELVAPVVEAFAGLLSVPDMEDALGGALSEPEN